MWWPHNIVEVFRDLNFVIVGECQAEYNSPSCPFLSQRQSQSSMVIFKYCTYIHICHPWLSYVLLLCFGVNVHVSGAGPKNISEIFTQSRLSPLANNVSIRLYVRSAWTRRRTNTNRDHSWPWRQVPCRSSAQEAVRGAQLGYSDIGMKEPHKGIGGLCWLLLCLCQNGFVIQTSMRNAINKREGEWAYLSPYSANYSQLYKLKGSHYMKDVVLTFFTCSNLSLALISHSLLSLISVKIQGLINAPRATMTPSQPNSSIPPQKSWEE